MNKLLPLLWGLLGVTSSVFAADPPLLDLSAEADQAAQAEAQANLSSVQLPDKPTAASATPAENEAIPEELGPIIPLWSYYGNSAPRYWGQLTPEFALCDTGRNQSPINLKENAAVGTSGLAALDVHYRSTPLKIINTDYRIQVNYPLGNYIRLGRERYELLHFRLHTPSEHQKDGFNYPMEVQLVHKDGEGNHVVIAMLFQEGKFNRVLQKLIDHLPEQVEQEMYHEKVKFNPAKFFPRNTDFFKYSGSLTTPPCTEGVYWMVFKQPLEASYKQIQKINEIMGDNARPIQPLFSRDILKSWSEPTQAKPIPFYEYY